MTHNAPLFATPKLLTFTCAAILCFGVTACTTTGTQTATTMGQNNTANYSKVDRALSNAARKAANSGDTIQSLSYLEKLYARNPDDERLALEFANGLRQNDFLLRADTVLTPFATKDNANIAVQNEYAAIKLAQGQYAAAQKYAWRAILQNEAAPTAHHYLGIALDAQEKHEPAEQSLRTALKLWDGDPTAVMNNLALNLTAQGKLDEAQDILEQAQAIAPQKIELERNLRIVKALKESSSYTYATPQADRAMLDTPRPSIKPR